MEQAPELMIEAVLAEIERLATNQTSIADLLPSWKAGIETFRSLSSRYGYRREALNERLRPAILKHLSHEGIAHGVALMGAWLDYNLACLRVFCLAERHDNVLMWSHYANNHSGVVLGLSGSKPVDANGFAIGKVRYEDLPHAAITTRRFVDRVLRGAEAAATSVRFEDHIFRKSSIWRYEQEWRVVEQVTADSDTPFLDVPIFGGQVQVIIFGCNAKQDDIDELITLARNFDPQIEFLRARPSNTSYSLAFERVS